METQGQIWKPCSSCKKSIQLNSVYFECSVSTCQGLRTGYVFCSVFCWERHLPGARHRDASALEKRAPKTTETQTSDSSITDRAPQKRIISASGAQASSPLKTSMDNEVLIVVSKMKTYIKERADMNTAQEVADYLSNVIRIMCNDAIDEARAEGRKTVMARDFKGG